MYLSSYGLKAITQKVFTRGVSSLVVVYASLAPSMPAYQPLLRDRPRGGVCGISSASGKDMFGEFAA